MMMTNRPVLKPLLVRKVSYLTLLETLIAFSLLSILLVFVFGFFREMTEISRLSEKREKESFTMRYVESRLAYIFERIVDEKRQPNDLLFYTEPANGTLSISTSLILTFDNGPRFDPAFSGDVLGRLYVDPKGRFRLSVWPLRIKNPYEFLQEEVLMERVVDVRYSFYSPPARVNDSEIVTEKIEEGENKTPTKDTWQGEWALCFDQMPSIVKVVVEFERDADELKADRSGSDKKTAEWVFHYVLPSRKNCVYYPPGTLLS